MTARDCQSLGMDTTGDRAVVAFNSVGDNGGSRVDTTPPRRGCLPLRHTFTRNIPDRPRRLCAIRLLEMMFGGRDHLEVTYTATVLAKAADRAPNIHSYDDLHNECNTDNLGDTKTAGLRVGVVFPLPRSALRYQVIR